MSLLEAVARITYFLGFRNKSNKAQTHFPRIREITGIRYDKMLFFDDWYVLVLARLWKTAHYEF
jgi:hypothetical protein